ncbi:hypothetical protein JKP88DRAFT_248742 [Tribonema minus]|uniref:Uncharacterized protein n=1 Tax=Tribonema minus TaxID=303371 RepID=A0A836CAY9_9STRA|nr:hypothetical protein JKP88DRAFT_248742 [Tribonema minus]
MSSASTTAMSDEDSDTIASKLTDTVAGKNVLALVGAGFISGTRKEFTQKASELDFNFKWTQWTGTSPNSNRWCGQSILIPATGDEYVIRADIVAVAQKLITDTIHDIPSNSNLSDSSSESDVGGGAESGNTSNTISVRAASRTSSTMVVEVEGRTAADGAVLDWPAVVGGLVGGLVGAVAGAAAVVFALLYSSSQRAGSRV